MEESGSTSPELSTEVGSPTTDALVDGITGLLRPGLDDLDGRVRLARTAQSGLLEQLEVLQSLLAEVQRQTECPLAMDEYIKKLQNSKRRVVVINNVLQATQERLAKLNTHMAKLTARKRALLETSS